MYSYYFNYYIVYWEKKRIIERGNKNRNKYNTKKIGRNTPIEIGSGCLRHVFCKTSKFREKLYENVHLIWKIQIQIQF